MKKLITTATAYRLTAQKNLAPPKARYVQTIFQTKILIETL
jgi:hypothetical protein